MNTSSDSEQLFMFRRISAHQGSLDSSDMHYKRSLYNVLVEWMSGETKYEPFDLIGKVDLVACAEYVSKYGLLVTSGLKRFRHIGKNSKTIDRMVNQARMIVNHRDPIWKAGFLVPQTHNQAMEIDYANGSTYLQNLKL
jgi:hypothetical protein